MRSGLFILALLLGMQPHGGQQDRDAGVILKAAREAMGGDARVRGVKSLHATGTRFATQAVRGGYTYDTEERLDVRYAGPDRFAQRTAQALGSHILEEMKGFVGARTVSSINGKPTNPPGEDVYVRRKAAELMLALLLRSDAWAGLTFEAVGPHRVRVSGLDGYVAFLEFNASTHLLEKLTYKERRQVRARNTILRKDIVTAPPAAGQGGRGGIVAGPGEATEIDIALTFHDHRKVDGVLLPHRITTTAVAANMLLWELRFEKLLINVPLKDADFQ